MKGGVYRMLTYQRITETYEVVLVIPAWEGRYHLFLIYTISI